MAKAAARRRGLQTSRKSGVTSTARKMDRSRHGFDTIPPARKKAGAFGQEGRGSRRQSGTALAQKGAAAAVRKMKTTARRVRRKAE